MGIEPGVVVHAFIFSIWEAEAGKSLKFKDSLFYKTSSRTARVLKGTLSQNVPPPGNGDWEFSSVLEHLSNMSEVVILIASTKKKTQKNQ